MDRVRDPKFGDLTISIYSLLVFYQFSINCCLGATSFYARSGTFLFARVASRRQAGRVVLANFRIVLDLPIQIAKQQLPRHLCIFLGEITGIGTSQNAGTENASRISAVGAERHHRGRACSAVCAVGAAANAIRISALGAEHLRACRSHGRLCDAARPGLGGHPITCQIFFHVEDCGVFRCLSISFTLNVAR